MEAVAIGSAVLSGLSQLQMGRAQQQLYGLQAKQAEMQAKAQMLKYRSEAINHRRQGVEVLKKVAQNLATINARAAAGSVDPFSGSVQNLAIYNLGKGVTDFYTTKENREMALLGGKIAEATGSIQAAQYTAAGNMAARQGQILALSSFGQAAMGAQDLGMFNFTSPVPSRVDFSTNYLPTQMGYQ